jgi:hypothetical protein
MRKTRFMSVLFLVLSAAFFFVPQFRQAFSLPIMIQALETGQIPKLVAVPTSQLEQWAHEAEAQRDARALAFVALRLPDAAERARLADLAVSMDPKLGWVYFSMISIAGNRKSPETLAWAKKLQQFDPESALGYLQEAEYYRENSPVLMAAMNPSKPDWQQRLQQTEWRAAMEKAYTAPRYDSYNLRRFDLERTIMRERGIATPVRMLYSMSSYPIPNLLNIREYATIMVNRVGREAEKAGKTKEALAHYWTVSHFGEQMQLGATNLIEQLIAAAIQKIAYVPLESLLRSSGQPEAAASVNYAAAEGQRRGEALRGKDVLSLSSNYVWNALMVNVFLALVMLFSGLTVFSVLYVNAKRWIRARKHGKTYDTVTIAENYLPVLLFAFCVGLYISYYPYARNFHYYMNATGEMHDLESVFMHTISLPQMIPGQQIPLGNPFVPYVWYALAGFALVLAGAFFGWLRRKPEAAKAPAAGGA